MSSDSKDVGKRWWNVICDRCFRKCKSTDIRQDGYLNILVCNRCYDRRPALEDPPHVKSDPYPVPFSRPVPADVYVTGNFNRWELIYTEWSDITDNWEDLT